MSASEKDWRTFSTNSNVTLKGKTERYRRYFTSCISRIKCRLRINAWVWRCVYLHILDGSFQWTRCAFQQGDRYTWLILLVCDFDRLVSGFWSLHQHWWSLDVIRSWIPTCLLSFRTDFKYWSTASISVAFGTRMPTWALCNVCNALYDRFEGVFLD